MTNKEQIIIDGVDVSGCIHYKNQSCIADYLLTDQDFSKAKCAYSPNCYYKQLQRKEQECDRYRKALKEIEEYCDMQISLTGDLPFRTTESDILDIINKAKERLNEE